MADALFLASKLREDGVVIASKDSSSECPVFQRTELTARKRLDYETKAELSMDSIL